MSSKKSTPTGGTCHVGTDQRATRKARSLVWLLSQGPTQSGVLRTKYSCGLEKGNLNVAIALAELLPIVIRDQILGFQSSTKCPIAARVVNTLLSAAVLTVGCEQTSRTLIGTSEKKASEIKIRLRSRMLPLWTLARDCRRVATSSNRRCCDQKARLVAKYRSI